MLKLASRLLRGSPQCVSGPSIQCLSTNPIAPAVQAQLSPQDHGSSISAQPDIHQASVVPPRQAWIESMDTSASPIGLMNLHPDIFAVCPRLDIIHENYVWQDKAKDINYAHSKTRAEVRGGGKKPWPQKGMGRARHGSIRSPLWRGGGVTHGPRAFTTKFFMLPYMKRIYGLTSTLSVKFAQDDLKVVADLDMPSDESGYLEQLCESRHWGPSVLLVDDTDIMGRNITIASSKIQHINLMPVYGLNVHSMIKHDTLILTVAAVNKIQERILYHLNRPDRFTIDKTPFKKLKNIQF